jgi:hypothetical protein
MNSLAFSNPWLLPGLAAVALPVWIHYLTRARPRRIVFPPYQFLVEACAGRQAVHRLRTIVLLTVRTLAVLLLALLFTRPFLKPTSAAADVEAAKRVVIIVDSSMSMRAVQRGVTLFARAQAQGAEVLRSLPSGSEAAVILAGIKPRPLLPALSRNLTALHDELTQAQPTCELGDPAAALAQAAQMLGGRGTIYVFSDFQESNWKDAGKLPVGIACRLQPVNSGPVDNVALTAAQVLPSAPVVGEPAEVVCTVFNCTPRPRQETVRLELGEFTQERAVSLPPYGSADAGFALTFPTDGLFTGQVSLPPDDLREDDTRFLSVRVHKALQLLLVSDADNADTRSAAFFISHALVPSLEAAPGLNLIRRHATDADRGVLETADVFLLASPAALTGEALEVISRRVNDGAQLVVFLDSPDALALAPASFSPPFTLIHSITADAGEPLVDGRRKLFADADAGDWSGLRLYRHYLTQMAPGRSNEVFLAHADGSAALTISPVGKGMAAFVNIPLTPDGGDLIGSPMFPSLLHELLSQMRRGGETSPATPGKPWEVEAPTAGDAPLVVTDPEKHAVNAKIISSGRVTTLDLPPARIPGIYTVTQGGKLVAAAAVNIDPRESDTRVISPETLVAGAGNVSVVRDENPVANDVRTRPLWPELAAGAALLIALEMLLLAFWRAPRAGLAVAAGATLSRPAKEATK